MAARWTCNLALASPIDRIERKWSLRFGSEDFLDPGEGAGRFETKSFARSDKEEFVESPAVEVRMGRGGRLCALELSTGRPVLAGRDERMVLKNDLEVLSVDDSSDMIGVNRRANCSKFAIHESPAA